MRQNILSKSLENFVVRRVNPSLFKFQTTIFSGSLRANKSVELEKAGFRHFKVNYKYNFANPDKNPHPKRRTYVGIG